LIAGHEQRHLNNYSETVAKSQYSTTRKKRKIKIKTTPNK